MGPVTTGLYEAYREMLASDEETVYIGGSVSA